MQSKARTVAEYLAELPAERRETLEAVRRVILDNLDSDYEEGMQYGMIGYYVPHRVFPAGYHCDPKQPLPFAALASQKNYLSLYLMAIYGDGDQTGWFQSAWTAAGKKLDMGKACVRFKCVDDLALDVVGEAIRRTPASAYVARYQALRAGHVPRPREEIVAASAKKKAAKKAATKNLKKTPRAAQSEQSATRKSTARKATAKKRPRR